MKPIKTLDELKKELMSEHGAVYMERFRYRIINNQLHRYMYCCWEHVRDANHGFLFDLEKWYYYEKPKKIVKESFEGFVSASEGVMDSIKIGNTIRFSALGATHLNAKP